MSEKQPSHIYGTMHKMRELIEDVGGTLPMPELKWVGRKVRRTGKRPLYAPWEPPPYTSVWRCVSTNDAEEPYRWVRCEATQ